MNELLKDKDDLTAERDAQVEMIAKLRTEVTDHLAALALTLTLSLALTLALALTLTLTLTQPYLTRPLYKVLTNATARTPASSQKP